MANNFRSSTCAYHVPHLPCNVRTAGQVEALRPLGLRLLRTVLRRFGAAQDPLAEGGGLLLAQHQAQFVAALRLALAPGAPPVAAAAGAALAASFLAAGLAGSDRVVRVWGHKPFHTPYFGSSTLVVAFLPGLPLVTA